MKNLAKLLVLCLALMLLTTTAFASNNVRTGEAMDTDPDGTSQEGDGQSYSSDYDGEGMRELVGGIQDEFAPNVTTQDRRQIRLYRRIHRLLCAHPYRADWK